MDDDKDILTTTTSTHYKTTSNVVRNEFVTEQGGGETLFEGMSVGK